MSNPVTITLEGLTKQQYQIADLLWSCDTQESVRAVIAVMPPEYKRDAETVYQLMIAAMMDQYTDIDEYTKDIIDRCSLR